MKNLNQFTKFISTQALLAVIGINCYAQNYEIDPSFNVGAGFSSCCEDAAFDIEIQSDNKILVAGNFEYYNGNPAISIVRINPNGSIDPTFSTGAGFFSYSSTPHVDQIKIQADGKIIASGYFDEYNNVIAKGIVRLNSDGTIDTTFNYNGSGFNTPKVERFFLHDDGKITVIGPFNQYNGITAKRIIRLRSDGSIDYSFNANLGFSNSSDLEDLDFFNGKYVVSGMFYNYDGNSALNVVCINYDGSIDTSFNSGFTNGLYVFVSKFTSDGKILIGGEFTEYDGQALNNLIRINQDGTVDSTFNNQWLNSPYTVNVYFSDNGKLWITGDYSSFGYARWLYRINEDGSADPSFNPDVYFDDDIMDDIEFSDDGKPLICGRISTFNGSPINGIVRLQNTLSIDSNPNIDENLIVYPNPATSSVNVNSKNISKSEIQLFDASGRKTNCTYVVLNDDNLILNTELLSNGIYTLSVVDETTQNVKIFIQK